MFRIRRIHDDLLPSNREALEQVQAILRDRIPEAAEADVLGIPAQLSDPLTKQLRGLLWVAEDGRGRVSGFSHLLHAPDIGLAWLDWISAAREARSGVGGALYERTRDAARRMGVPGIFLECLPDDAALCKDEALRKENGRRLKFYENFGARPIIGTAWETPVPSGDDTPPYLVFDDLGQGTKLSAARARVLARAILERKYSDLCPPEYLEAIVGSFVEDPVRLRPPRYTQIESVPVDVLKVAVDARVALFAHDGHAIHHVRERGYVETPTRIGAIARELDKTALFEPATIERAPEAAIAAVHDMEMVSYFKKMCAALPEGRSVYPYVFPVRNAARKPRDLEARVGYYCIDTFTPLSRSAWEAARRAVDCAWSAARSLARGQRLAYALVRPPGHHAERRSFGGFCYLNNAAIAAHELTSLGPVALLDVDYHHGNGQQDIFWRRKDVLTVSIHGHPSFAYPYFCGFADERGEGEGEGFNVNLPLPEAIDARRFLETLDAALAQIERFKPSALVVSLGLDTARRDPTGTWSLTAKDFESSGFAIGRLGLPTAVIQEGGYDTRVLGVNARRFFTGLWRGANRKAP